MDATQIKTFCDAAARLLPQLGDYASVDAAERKLEDDALVRQLRVAAGAVASAMIEVARMVPPPNVGSPS